MLFPTRENTCAVIVTYHPNINFLQSYTAIAEQFPFVFVVDNNSNTNEILFIEQCIQPSLSHIVFNSQNLGIAAALNQGVALASQRGFQWVVTFDQDTNVNPHLLETLIETTRKFGEANVVVGSNYWDANQRKYFINDFSQTKFCRRKTLITAGMLFPLRIIKEIGGFREDYFIDSVDFEFCLRARKNGWPVIVTTECIMTQFIGKKSNNKLSGFDHPPIRKYYIVRNTIVTVITYFFHEPKWCLGQFYRLWRDLIAIIVFEDKKINKLIAYFVGVIHGLVGRMGPYKRE